MSEAFARAATAKQDVPDVPDVRGRMAKLTVTDSGFLDGEYEADLSYFTNRELHTIKKATGLRAGEFSEALEALDNDMIVAIGAVVLGRAGHADAIEVLWDLAAGKIVLDLGDEEPVGDALPPGNGLETEPGPEDRSDPSGPGSNGTSDPPVSDLSPIGQPV
jgi:hypothetical protein